LLGYLPDMGAEALTLEVVSVDLGELLPFRRHSALLKNCINGTDGQAGTAVNALTWVDIVLLVFFGGMDTIYRAYIHTGRILLADARLGNDIGHRNRNHPFLASA
jgi:hypothetical protein